MSLTGLFLLVFIALHLFLNLLAVLSADEYRKACEFMDTNILVKIMVPVLAGGFILHILFSMYVEFKNWTGRPADMRYAVPCRTKASSFASKNMFVLGVIVLLFLVLHFFHFWAHMQLQSFLGNEGEDPYGLVVKTFQNGGICLLYIVWFAAIYYHVSHGFWSAFHTLGANTQRYLPILQLVAKIYAIVVLVGYCVIPAYFYFCVEI